MQSLGEIKTISKSLSTQLDPVTIFQTLSEQLKLKNTLLLESSEIDSKANLSSILMLKAAIRIECNDQQVVLTALTQNGFNALVQISACLEQSEFSLGLNFDKANQLLKVTFKTSSDLIDEEARLKSASPIEVLRVINKAFKITANNPYSNFLCGVFAFDFIATFEKIQPIDMGNNTCPDYVFYLAETLLVIDHKKNVKRLYCNHFSDENSEAIYNELARQFAVLENQINHLPDPKQDSIFKEKTNDNPLSVDISDNEYQAIVKQLKQNIINGDVFQVVPSRSYSLSCHSPIDSYKALKKSNPSPYLFFMQDESFVLFGASPESALKYNKQDNCVQLYPIAGTRIRGRNVDGEINLDLDAKLEAELKLDEKEVSEHMMLVDLARNDIAKISKAGTTHVPKLLAVDRYSQVMHLVSRVEGQLRSDLDALHAYQSCMNMGTLTGAPKIKATQLIRQVENKRRGSYGGAVGYINSVGDMDTCIVIRSAFYKDGIAYVQAGAGIVYDSDPASEAQETENKAKAVINAILASNNKLQGSKP